MFVDQLESSGTKFKKHLRSVLRNVRRALVVNTVVDDFGVERSLE